MSAFTQSLMDRLRSSTASRIILALSLLATTAAWYVSRQAVQDNAFQDFEFQAAELQSAIHDRMFIYEQVLWGGVGFFDANETVTREQWRSYVNALDLDEHWPGLRSMGYAEPIESASELQAHISRVRTEGFSDYEVRPAGTRDYYAPFVYTEPLERNLGNFGFDVWAIPPLQAAMQEARASGLAVTSAGIRSPTTGLKVFTTFLPVYDDDGNLRGWVVGGYELESLMPSILGSDKPDLSYEIFDQGVVSEDTLLFDSNDVFHRSQPEIESAFTTSSIIELQGRTWTIEVRSENNVISGAEANQPTFIALGGLLINLLLFVALTSQHRARSLAESMAETMTARLRKTTNDLEIQTVELQQHTRQLVRSNRELEQFAYAASHDLQEPLRSIGNYANLLTQDYEANLGPEGTRWLGYISTGAQRMTDLLRELLGYASVDGQVDSLAALDLDLALDSALLDLAKSIDEAQVQISRAPLPIVVGNEFQMERLFVNLVGNAIKFRSAARPAKVWIGATTQGDQWRITITDNGIGIKAEYYERVFELFRRLSPQTTYPGTGIGLAVCRKIVEAHGGEIGVESSNEGSTFWFTLPHSVVNADIDLRIAPKQVQRTPTGGNPARGRS